MISLIRIDKKKQKNTKLNENQPSDIGHSTDVTIQKGSFKGKGESKGLLWWDISTLWFWYGIHVLFGMHKIVPLMLLQCLKTITKILPSSQYLKL